MRQGQSNIALGITVLVAVTFISCLSESNVTEQVTSSQPQAVTMPFLTEAQRLDDSLAIDLGYTQRPPCLSDGKTLIPSTLPVLHALAIKRAVAAVDSSPISSIEFAHEETLSSFRDSLGTAALGGKTAGLLLASTCSCV